MHAADLSHSSHTLQDKLHRLYDLKQGEKVALGFREPYLKLLRAFGNPQEKLPPVIHVAGTNGKGSVIAMLRAVLEHAGYNVHVYTSPHLQQFNERIRIKGELISDSALEALVDRALDLNAGRETTFFEITTAMALAAFAQNPADIVLLETGLGGRLDCTNIIEKPLLSVISHVSFDHMEFLGGTIEQIAAEKAGIMKPGVPCVIDTSNNPQVMKVLVDKAKALSIPLYLSMQGKDIAPPSLPGPHQIQNARIARRALDVIADKFPVTPKNIERGLQKIDWPGRLQKMPSPSPEHEIWYDGGHNQAAGHALAAQAELWATQDQKPLHLIIGMKKSKQAEAFLTPLRPYASNVTLIPLESMESISHLDGAARAETLAQGLESALQGGSGRILICGSLYLAAPLAKALS